MENKVTLLDKLWVICEHAGYSDIPYEFCKNDHIYEQEIKEALIDYEELKKALEIIKERKVHIGLFLESIDNEDYTIKIHSWLGFGLGHELTDKQYDLLSEVLK